MKYLLLSFLILSANVSAESTIILIPSDYEDYTYADRIHFEVTGQMKDESFADFVHREEFLMEDLELEGYIIDD